MSTTIYCYQEGYTTPETGHGPLTEEDDYIYGDKRTLPPTHDERVACGWYAGPSFSYGNIGPIIMSLGYEWNGSYGEYDAADMLSRVTLARALHPADGVVCEPVEVAPGWVDYALTHEGMFERAYEDIEGVCRQAIAWDVPVLAA